MTAPARAPGAAPRTRTTAVPQRERGTGTRQPTLQPERTSGTRGRTAAAERAYERRAQRTRGRTAPAEPAERKAGSASRVSFVLLVMGLLAVGVVATLWFATQSTADAYKLEQAKTATNALSGQVNRLQQHVAQEDSPPSLAQAAQQLGMVPATDPAHLVVGPDGKVTMIGQPSAAQRPAPPAPTAPPAGSTATSAAQPKPPTSPTSPTPPAHSTAAAPPAATPPSGAPRPAGG